MPEGKYVVVGCALPVGDSQRVISSGLPLAEGVHIGGQYLEELADDHQMVGGAEGWP